MEIDIYQTCPCHSEKKIKFCCGKDIVADLNKILSLSKSKQLIAALENLDRTIARLGPRDCLLTIKTHLLLSLNEYDKAGEVNKQFLASHPNHPIGHQHRAQLLAAESRSSEAVEALQDALEAAPPNEVPVSLANAFRTAGMLLFTEGDVIAGRAHLSFASQIREGDDEISARLILQSFRSPDIPIQIKHDFSPSLPTEETSWSRLLANAIRYEHRGQWRQALRRAEALEQRHPGVPEIVRAVACWNSFLGRREAACEAFGRLAAIESLPFDERVDAEALRLLLQDQPLTRSLDVLLLTYEIDDLQSLIEQATASPRMIAGTITGHHFVDDGPPPTAAFLLLDRDEVKSSEGMSFEQFPSVMAETLIYGKQTDRSARLELVIVRSDDFQKIKTELVNVLSQHLNEPISEEVVDEISLLDHMMSFQWHLPRDMSHEERRKFISEKRKSEILNVWTTIPFIPLDGQTANEAKSDPAKQVTLAALVSIIEQGTDAQINTDFDFDLLREKLGLDQRTLIDPTNLDVSKLSPVQAQQIDFEKLDDEPLIEMYVSASTIGNLVALRRCAQVILQRAPLEKFVRFESVYMTLAKLTMDTEKALELMHKARNHATATGRPVGHLLVDELEIRLERGLIESCPELLRTIQTNYGSDADVQYQLATVLQKFGIMDAEGRIRTQIPAETVAQAEAPSQPTIWTPNAPTPAGPVESTAGQKTKLWLPE